MEAPLKPSFREFASSGVVARHSAAVSRGAVIVATVVATFILLFRDWGFGLWWLLIIPVLWFAVSIVVAFPFQSARLWWVWSNWNRPQAAKFGSAAIDVLMYVVVVAVTFFGLKYLAVAIYGYSNG